jgi:hypothetical protein
VSPATSCTWFSCWSDSSTTNQAEPVNDLSGWVCGAAAAGGEGSSSGSSKAVLSSWDSLASTLPADISSQPEMLQGGSLREYQLQVRSLALQLECWFLDLCLVLPLPLSGCKFGY